MEYKIDTMSRINEKFNKMSKGHKKIATFIIDHYEQAAFMTAAKLGTTVGVSESTVVRFAYSLGYEGYPEFQEDLAEWVKNKLNSVQKIGVKYGKSTQSEILTSVLTSDMEKISDTIEHVDPHTFEMAVDIILEAKNVYIIGLMGENSVEYTESTKKEKSFYHGKQNIKSDASTCKMWSGSW